MVGAASELVLAQRRGSVLREQWEMSSVSTELLSILVCPATKAPVIQVDDWIYSTDRATRRRYPIRDGIPIMLIDESEVVPEAEFDRVMAQIRQTDSPAGLDPEK